MESDTFIFAFLATLIAGMATGIGGALVFFRKAMNLRFLSFALGLSAGVMVYVSFVEILPLSLQHLKLAYGPFKGELVSILAFLGGIFFIGIIDRCVPEDTNPHAARSAEPLNDAGEGSLEQKRTMKRAGMMTMLAIGLHNFPEGLATFTAASTDASLGMAIAFAIVIHNIPEGIAVAVPIYFATGSRKKAFMYSFISGLAEPVGAIVGIVLLLPFLTPAVMGGLFAGVAGIMVFIALDELLPAAEAYGEHHLCTYGVVSGMAIMAFSLLLLTK